MLVEDVAGIPAQEAAVREYALGHEGATIGSLLDLGCGKAPCWWLPCLSYLGVDIYPPYLERARELRDRLLAADPLRLPRECRFAQLDLSAPLPWRDKSFDVVVLSDVIEHFEKEQGLALLSRAKEIAAYGVLVRTPNGFIPQETDAWGLGGDHYQAHRAGWTPGDLARAGASHLWIAKGAVLVAHRAEGTVTLDPPGDFLAAWIKTKE